MAPWSDYDILRLRKEAEIEEVVRVKTRLRRTQERKMLMLQGMRVNLEPRIRYVRSSREPIFTHPSYLSRGRH